MLTIPHCVDRVKSMKTVRLNHITNNQIQGGRFISTPDSVAMAGRPGNFLRMGKHDNKTTKQINDLREKRLIKRAMLKLDRYIAARESGTYISENNQEHRQSVRLINAINRGNNEDND